MRWLHKHIHYKYVDAVLPVQSHSNKAAIDSQ